MSHTCRPTGVAPSGIPRRPSSAPVLSCSALTPAGRRRPSVALGLRVRQGNSSRRGRIPLPRRLPGGPTAPREYAGRHPCRRWWVRRRRPCRRTPSASVPAVAGRTTRRLRRHGPTARTPLRCRAGLRPAEAHAPPPLPSSRPVGRLTRPAAPTGPTARTPLRCVRPSARRNPTRPPRSGRSSLSLLHPKTRQPPPARQHSPRRPPAPPAPPARRLPPTARLHDPPPKRSQNTQSPQHPHHENTTPHHAPELHQVFSKRARIQPKATPDVVSARSQESPKNRAN